MFCFEKFQKIQIFFNSVFGNSLAGHASHKALVASLLRSSHDSLESESPSREKHLENFSKFLGFGHFRDLVPSGSFSRELTQKVSQLTRGWISQSQKRHRQNFQNFVQGILVTCFGDLLVGQLSHENRVLCTNRVKS